jgi:hypothetical protein
VLKLIRGEEEEEEERGGRGRRSRKRRRRRRKRRRSRSPHGGVVEQVEHWDQGQRVLIGARDGDVVLTSHHHGHGPQEGLSNM